MAASLMLFSRDDMIGIVPSTVPIGDMLWPFKHNLEQYKTLESGDPYTTSSQMQQQPSPAGGGMFKDKYWRHYEVVPAGMDMIRIYGDTAQKTKEHNDYSVFQCWGRVPNQGIYLLDQIRGKWEAPELESKLFEFWNKWKPTLYKPLGANLVKIEDKSSGSSLIQSIKKNYMIPIEPIQRNTDKVLRAMGVVKYFASGYIFLPLDVDWISDYKEEFRKFTPLMTHKHDDQIDPTMDAVEDLIVFEDMLYSSNAIGS
jgi:predicted phage terminase large subunit-like protein